MLKLNWYSRFGPAIAIRDADSLKFVPYDSPFDFMKALVANVNYNEDPERRIAVTLFANLVIYQDGSYDCKFPLESDQITDYCAGYHCIVFNCGPAIGYNGSITGSTYLMNDTGPPQKLPVALLEFVRVDCNWNLDPNVSYISITGLDEFGQYVTLKCGPYDSRTYLILESPSWTMQHVPDHDYEHEGELDIVETTPIGFVRFEEGQYNLYGLDRASRQTVLKYPNVFYAKPQTRKPAI
jgi:hypothetical protein